MSIEHLWDFPLDKNCWTPGILEDFHDKALLCGWSHHSNDLRAPWQPGENDRGHAWALLPPPHGAQNQLIRMKRWFNECPGKNVYISSELNLPTVLLQAWVIKTSWQILRLIMGKTSWLHTCQNQTRSHCPGVNSKGKLGWLKVTTFTPHLRSTKLRSLGEICFRHVKMQLWKSYNAL